MEGHSARRPSESADELALRTLARDALRGALSAEYHGRPIGDDSAEVVRELCRAAHQTQCPIERLLIVVKEARRELPEARRITRLDADAAIAGLITRCIDEYFRVATGPASGPAPLPMRPPRGEGH